MRQEKAQMIAIFLGMFTCTLRSIKKGKMTMTRSTTISMAVKALQYASLREGLVTALTHMACCCVSRYEIHTHTPR